MGLFHPAMLVYQRATVGCSSPEVSVFCKAKNWPNWDFRYVWNTIESSKACCSGWKRIKNSKWESLPSPTKRQIKDLLTVCFGYPTSFSSQNQKGWQLYKTTFLVEVVPVYILTRSVAIMGWASHFCRSPEEKYWKEGEMLILDTTFIHSTKSHGLVVERRLAETERRKNILLSKISSSHLGGGFKDVFIISPTWGNDPIWQVVFAILCGLLNHRLL